MPIQSELANTVETAAEYRPEPPDDPIVTSQSSTPDASTRTLRNWVADTHEQLADETGDDRREYLTFHDLRRTWATLLKGAEVAAR